MRNDGQKPHGSVVAGARPNGRLPGSLRTLSGYLRIVSSGASTVASTVRSAASAATSIVEKDDDARRDQVLCAGFDKLECEGDAIRRVLLLGYQSGFQVWDVEDADNVHDLVTRHDGAVCFLQMLPKPASSVASGDKYANSRPMLVVGSYGCISQAAGLQEAVTASSHESIRNGHHGHGIGYLGPFIVRFYSLTSQTYVHDLKFRLAVYSVRCSSRIIAILQASQIHCFNAATLEREYTILTNPVITPSLASGDIGYGPLALGPRWLAYSGSSVAISDSGRVSPQHLTYSASFPNHGSNANLVAHYAKESSKQLAQGIVTLSDLGYKKLSRYCSELLPDSNHSMHAVSAGFKTNGTMNGHSLDMDSVGMVIVRDVLNKSIITQFKAHKSPISALCFDPSGTLLVTASVQGHNINVFRIMPINKNSGGSQPKVSCFHLYRLQRGFTNAVIRDISFSDDSSWIMVSTSRGTNHLFAISPSGGYVNLHSLDANLKTSGQSEAAHQNLSDLDNLIAKSSPPVTLCALSRIRSSGNGWRGTVSSAAAAATGKIGYVSGVTASTFHHCKGSHMNARTFSLTEKYHLLVFSSFGCLMQYSLRMHSADIGPVASVGGSYPGYEPANGTDPELLVEAVKKWNICQKQSRKGRDDGLDIYGENGKADSCTAFSDGGMKGVGTQPVDRLDIAGKKGISEEKRNLYISQAELHMHPYSVPLWAKSGIHFQAMITDGIKMGEQSYGINMDEENDAYGEFEIERVLTCPVEVRLNDLVPVFNYLPSPRSHQARTISRDRSVGSEIPQIGDLSYRNQPSLSDSSEPQLMTDGCGISKNGSLLSSSQSSSYESNKNGTIAAYFLDNSEDTIDSLKIKNTVTGSVNIDSPRMTDPLDVVNNRDRDHLKMEAQFKIVNNSEAPMMANEDDEFD